MELKVEGSRILSLIMGLSHRSSLPIGSYVAVGVMQTLLFALGDMLVGNKPEIFTYPKYLHVKTEYRMRLCKGRPKAQRYQKFA